VLSQSTASIFRHPELGIASHCDVRLRVREEGLLRSTPVGGTRA
jgi:hypothetical protein